MTNSVVLSRYFDNNVHLVAGVCSKCYLEDDDVRIISVNRNFLEQVEALKLTRGSTKNNCKKLQTSITNDQPCNTKQAILILNDDDKFKTITTSKDSELVKHKQKLNSVNLWIPPRSPHNLIEESFYHDPWSLLVATIFLNKTSCKYARARINEFLRDFPSPLDVLEKRPADLEKYFLELGLFRRRAEQIWRMSYDYVHKNWRRAKELHGIGKYGEDAFKLFVLGDIEAEPADRFLRIYRDWVRLKEKELKKATLCNQGKLCMCIRNFFVIRQNYDIVNMNVTAIALDQAIKAIKEEMIATKVCLEEEKIFTKHKSNKFTMANLSL